MAKRTDKIAKIAKSRIDKENGKFYYIDIGQFYAFWGVLVILFVFLTLWRF